MSLLRCWCLFQVQLLCGKVALEDEMSMKQIYLMYWYDKVCYIYISLM